MDNLALLPGRARPCPFCECADGLQVFRPTPRRTGFRVQCKNCQATGPKGTTATYAVELWDEAPRDDAVSRAELRLHADKVVKEAMKMELDDEAG